MNSKKAYVYNLHTNCVKSIMSVEWRETKYEGVRMPIRIDDVELSTSEKERCALLQLVPHDTEIENIGWRFTSVVGVICDET